MCIVAKRQPAGHRFRPDLAARPGQAQAGQGQIFRPASVKSTSRRRHRPARATAWKAPMMRTESLGDGSARPLWPLGSSSRLLLAAAVEAAPSTGAAARHASICRVRDDAAQLRCAQLPGEDLVSGSARGQVRRRRSNPAARTTARAERSSVRAAADLGWSQKPSRPSPAATFSSCSCCLQPGQLQDRRQRWRCTFSVIRVTHNTI